MISAWHITPTKPVCIKLEEEYGLGVDMEGFERFADFGCAANRWHRNKRWSCCGKICNALGGDDGSLSNIRLSNARRVGRLVMPDMIMWQWIGRGLSVLGRINGSRKSSASEILNWSVLPT